jgi:toxin YoeB
MASLEIFWTETAIKQRNQILKYWNNRNKSTEYSKKLRLKINENLQVLKNQPNSGKKTDIDAVKCLVLGHYSILYKLHDNQIIVVAFWDNRQNPEKLLDLLK